MIGPSQRHTVFAGSLLLALALGVPALAQHEIDPETWIQMRRQFRQKETGPAPTIEEDVAALAGRDARRAGPRLIDRGVEVLPAVHAALLASDVEPRYAHTLLQVVRPLEHPSSVPVLLELLRRGGPSQRAALLTLAHLPATDEAAEFIRALASDTDEPWHTRRMATTWYGFHRDPRGRAFAESLRADPDLERRAAALWVLARLGDRTTLEPITELLAAPPKNSDDLLLLGLAELVGPDEFKRRAPDTMAWRDGYKDSLRYARYRSAAGEEKVALCTEMLRAEMPGHRELAVRCLLEAGRADDLRPAAALDLEAPGRDALVRNDIRNAGWYVIDTDTEFRIVPRR